MDSSLENAIKIKDVSTVKKILESQTSINKANKEGLYPIHLAAAISNNIEILDLFIKHGYDLNMRDANPDKEMTPLMYALMGIRGETFKSQVKPNLKILIENGADVNMLCPKVKNRNLLQFASFFESIDFDVYKMLVTANGNQTVDLDHQDSEGNTALILLLTQNNPTIKSRQKIQLQKILLLIEEGSDLHLKKRSRNAIDIIRTLKETNKQNQVYDYLFRYSNFIFNTLLYNIGVDKQNINYIDNAIPPVKLDYNTKIDDPITLESKTIQEWLDESVNNIIFVDETMNNFAVVPRQQLRKVTINQTSLVFKCNKVLEALNITRDKVNLREPFFYIDSIGLGGTASGSLVQMYELFKKILYYTPISHPKQHRVFMVSTDRGRKIEPLASASIINYGNINKQGKAVNIKGEIINVVGQKHCGSGTYGYFATLVPVINKSRIGVLTGKVNQAGTHEEVVFRSRGGKTKTKRKKSKTNKKTRRRR